MIMTATYRVKADLYRADTTHNISLTTTEYTHHNEMLVHIQMGKNLNNQLNSRAKHAIKRDFMLPDEQFLCKTTNSRGKTKSIPKSIFAKKLTAFNQNQTTVEKEILEEYRYLGKDGTVDTIPIAIREQHGELTAVIDFTGSERYANFVAPLWLTPMAE